MTDIRSIQYLRGVASIAVVLYHMGIGSLRFAEAGVDLFFIISGVVISLSGLRGKNGILAFQLKRIARVAPTYWIITIFGIICASFFPAVFTGAFQINNQHSTSITILPEDVLLSLAFFPHYSTNNPGYVLPFIVVGWTLCFEMFFYFIFSLFLRLRYFYTIIFFTTSMLALVGFGYLFQDSRAIAVVWTSPLLIEFVLGIYLGLWFRSSKKELSVCRSFLFFALILVGVFLLMALSKFRHDDESLRLLFYGMPCCVLAFGCLGLERSQLMNYAAPLKYLGDFSYSIYLLHPFIISFFIYQDLFENRYLSLIIIFTSCIGLSSLFAMFVELPLSKITQKFFLAMQQDQRR